MNCERDISYQTPAVICRHVAVPSTLITFFHHFDILMETLSLLLINVAKIRGKFAEVAVQVMHFNAHSAPKVS